MLFIILLCVIVVHININMVLNEKLALLQYLEFHLLSLCSNMEKNIDSESTQLLYQLSYEILMDIDDSIILDEELGPGNSLLDK